MHQHRPDYHPHHVASLLTTALAFSNNMRKFSPGQQHISAAECLNTCQYEVLKV
jgi:hypothetical protein